MCDLIFIQRNQQAWFRNNLNALMPPNSTRSPAQDGAHSVSPHRKGDNHHSGLSSSDADLTLDQSSALTPLVSPSSELYWLKLILTLLGWSVAIYTDVEGLLESLSQHSLYRQGIKELLVLPRMGTIQAAISAFQSSCASQEEMLFLTAFQAEPPGRRLCVCCVSTAPADRLNRFRFAVNQSQENEKLEASPVGVVLLCSGSPPSRRKEGSLLSLPECTRLLTESPTAEASASHSLADFITIGLSLPAIRAAMEEEEQPGEAASELKNDDAKVHHVPFWSSVSTQTPSYWIPGLKYARGKARAKEAETALVQEGDASGPGEPGALRFPLFLSSRIPSSIEHQSSLTSSDSESTTGGAAPLAHKSKVKLEQTKDSPFTSQPMDEPQIPVDCLTSRMQEDHPLPESVASDQTTGKVQQAVASSAPSDLLSSLYETLEVASPNISRPTTFSPNATPLSGLFDSPKSKEALASPAPSSPAPSRMGSTRTASNSWRAPLLNLHALFTDKEDEPGLTEGSSTVSSASVTYLAHRRCLQRQFALHLHEAAGKEAPHGEGKCQGGIPVKKEETVSAADCPSSFSWKLFRAVVSQGKAPQELSSNEREGEVFMPVREEMKANTVEALSVLQELYEGMHSTSSSCGNGALFNTKQEAPESRDLSEEAHKTTLDAFFNHSRTSTLIITPSFASYLRMLPVADVLYAGIYSQQEVEQEERAYYDAFAPTRGLHRFPSVSLGEYPVVPPNAFSTLGAPLCYWSTYLQPPSTAPSAPLPWEQSSTAPCWAPEASPRLPVLNDVPYRSTYIPAISSTLVSSQSRRHATHSPVYPLLPLQLGREVPESPFFVQFVENPFHDMWEYVHRRFMSKEVKRKLDLDSIRCMGTRRVDGSSIITGERRKEPSKASVKEEKEGLGDERGRKSTDSSDEPPLKRLKLFDQTDADSSARSGSPKKGIMRVPMPDVEWNYC